MRKIIAVLLIGLIIPLRSNTMIITDVGATNLVKNNQEDWTIRYRAGIDTPIFSKNKTSIHLFGLLATHHQTNDDYVLSGLQMGTHISKKIGYRHIVSVGLTASILIDSTYNNDDIHRLGVGGTMQYTHKLSDVAFLRLYVDNLIFQENSGKRFFTQSIGTGLGWQF